MNLLCRYMCGRMGISVGDVMCGALIVDRLVSWGFIVCVI